MFCGDIPQNSIALWKINLICVQNLGYIGLKQIQRGVKISVKEPKNSILKGGKRYVDIIICDICAGICRKDRYLVFEGSLGDLKTGIHYCIASGDHNRSHYSGTRKDSIALHNHRIDHFVFCTAQESSVSENRVYQTKRREDDDEFT